MMTEMVTRNALILYMAYQNTIVMIQKHFFPIALRRFSKALKYKMKLRA